MRRTIRSACAALVAAAIAFTGVTACQPSWDTNATTPVVGTDIFNGNSDAYNFDVARAQGVQFVIHKASQGYIGGPGGWKDWKFVGAISRARASGMIVGGYHWLLRYNGAAQADNFFQALQSIGGPQGVLAAVDVERNDWDQTLNPDTATLRDFLSEWNRLTNFHPILIYSAEWYWGYYMGEPRDFANYPLWWAGYYEPYGAQQVQYAVQNVTPHSFYPFGGWTSYVIRQWTSQAYISGVPSDADVFYGTTDNLLSLTGVTPPPVKVTDQWNYILNHRFAGEPSLRPGDHGNAVRDLQKTINNLEGKQAGGILDSVYGAETVRWVKNFQAYFKIPDTPGNVGWRTWSLLARLATTAGV